MRIQHNLQSMNANRQLGITSQSLGKSSEKLSSGYKINRAADDAAGLTISEKMRKQVRGLKRGSDNSLDGISLVQTADGAMAEVHDMLHRGTELAIQAANGTMSYTDRMACQREINQIINEIDAIRERTYFNEIPVFQGGYTTGRGKMITPPIKAGDTVVVGDNLPEWFSQGMDPVTLAQGEMASTYTTESPVIFDRVHPDNTVETGVRGTVSIQHVATYIDLSGFDPSKINGLDGKGFFTTCCTCDNRYSIKFDANSNANSVQASGKHFIFNVGIQGASSPSDLIDRILAATKDFEGELGNPEDHYTKFTKDGNRLIIYEDRASVTEREVLETIGVPVNEIRNASYPFDPQTRIGWENVGYSRKPDKSRERGIFGKGVSETATEDTAAEYEKTILRLYKSINVHAGAEADMVDKIIINLPNISSKSLGINDVNVTMALDPSFLRDTKTYLTEPDPVKREKLKRLQRKIDSHNPEDQRYLRAAKGPAEQAIDKFSEALAYVSGERSRMGAYQNRLEHTIRNLDNIVENTTAAESRIRDTDMADEMVKHSMQNILQQAGQSILAQANQTPQGVMALIQG